jgi:2-polyprenyl-6-methoxyphenol hydroxylase-like FAD-dependent oxidoreductase
MLDTVNLAWKLAAVIDGRAPAGLLDTYHNERHPYRRNRSSASRRPADPPDAHIAWAAAIGEPAGPAALALREALSCWFGTPSGSACSSMRASAENPIGFGSRRSGDAGQHDPAPTSNGRLR